MRLVPLLLLTDSTAVSGPLVRIAADSLRRFSIEFRVLLMCSKSLMFCVALLLLAAPRRAPRESIAAQLNSGAHTRADPLENR